MNEQQELHLEGMETRFTYTADELKKIDDVLRASKLYDTGEKFWELLQFVNRMRDFAPFNAMLLHMQKPGLTYAATIRDWAFRFGRYPKEDARPLIILWPFGPVELVYDILDTYGNELPEGAFSFPAKGDIDEYDILRCAEKMKNKNIRIKWVDQGDANAGSIQAIMIKANGRSKVTYLMAINNNHPPAVQYITIAHELGHLFLGHLGADRELHIPNRNISYAMREIEAELVSHIAALRNGVTSRPESYLEGYVHSIDSVDQLDIYHIFRATRIVQELLT